MQTKPSGCRGRTLKPRCRATCKKSVVLVQFSCELCGFLLGGDNEFLVADSLRQQELLGVLVNIAAGRLVLHRDLVSDLDLAQAGQQKLLFSILHPIDDGGLVRYARLVCRVG